MKGLTRKERNRVYMRAMELVESRHSEFICNAIECSVNYSIGCNEETFPELFLFRDDYSVDAWLSQEGSSDEYMASTEKGNTIRQIILIFCIEMTKTKNHE